MTFDCNNIEQHVALKHLCFHRLLFVLNFTKLFWSQSLIWDHFTTISGDTALSRTKRFKNVSYTFYFRAMVNKHFGNVLYYLISVMHACIRNVMFMHAVFISIISSLFYLISINNLRYV